MRRVSLLPTPWRTAGSAVGYCRPWCCMLSAPVVDDAASAADARFGLSTEKYGTGAREPARRALRLGAGRLIVGFVAAGFTRPTARPKLMTQRWNIWTEFIGSPGPFQPLAYWILASRAFLPRRLPGTSPAPQFAGARGQETRSPIEALSEAASRGRIIRSCRTHEKPDHRENLSDRSRSKRTPS